jgi:hypothetical protein
MKTKLLGLIVGVVFVATSLWTLPTVADTLSPANGELGTNPQGESFGASVQGGFSDTFYVTITGTGLQTLDVGITSGSEIDVNQGFEIYIPGVSIPENYSIPTGTFEYSVEPGSYTIVVLGQTVFGYPVPGDLTYLSGSYEGTITAGPAAETPLPAALPFFAAGLGALGFMGWRRKRRAVTA